MAFGQRKKCLDCGKYDRFSKGLCNGCWKIAYGKPIRKVSKNHQKTLDEYSPIRKEFLKAYPNCQIKLECCTVKATCIHHKKGKHSKELYLDKKYFMASCLACNNKVETLGQKAYDLGLRIRHNTKTE